MPILQFNLLLKDFQKRFSDVFEKSNKYPHFRLVEQLDTESFMGFFMFEDLLG